MVNQWLNSQAVILRDGPQCRPIGAPIWHTCCTESPVGSDFEAKALNPFDCAGLRVVLSVRGAKDVCDVRDGYSFYGTGWCLHFSRPRV